MATNRALFQRDAGNISGLAANEATHASATGRHAPLTMFNGDRPDTGAASETGQTQPAFSGAAESKNASEAIGELGKRAAETADGLRIFGRKALAAQTGQIPPDTSAASESTARPSGESQTTESGSSPGDGGRFDSHPASGKRVNIDEAREALHRGRTSISASAARDEELHSLLNEFIGLAHDLHANAVHQRDFAELAEEVAALRNQIHLTIR